MTARPDDSPYVRPRPGLKTFKIYNGYWYWGRPTMAELHMDLRALFQKNDLASPGLREAWERGDRDQFLVDTLEEPIRYTEGKSIGIKRWPSQEVLCLSAVRVSNDMDSLVVRGLNENGPAVRPCIALRSLVRWGYVELAESRGHRGSKAVRSARQSIQSRLGETRMSTVDGQNGETNGTESSAAFDLKLEVVVIPVRDADRSKAFYAGLGWKLDADSFDNGFRIVQFTPPGSQCSVQFGTRITDAPPGSAQGLYLIVSDIDGGRDELMNRGAKVGEVFHSGAPGAQLDPEGTSDRLNGPDPDHKSYSSFATFDDPDGNSWLLQEVTDRLPGRLDPTMTSFNSAGDLARALRRPETAHGEHEKRIGRTDPDWPDWYAEYMVREQTGQERPA